MKSEVPEPSHKLQELKSVKRSLGDTHKGITTRLVTFRAVGGRLARRVVSARAKMSKKLREETREGPQ